MVNFLLQAQKITRENAAMNWTFINCPQDGEVMLTWQPTSQMGTQCASDGYIWTDTETNWTTPDKSGYVRLLELTLPIMH